ncbi:MAG: FHA domain-containing protein [Saprospiraceae bacterium]|nr:FHA domain-containing protein [Saprospiraceae bacterium]
MAASTQQFKSAGSNLGQTIGQSWSMISGKDIPNYSLLFLDETLTRKRGEHETIFMPHIVLGRSSRCHVRYSDEFRTVSREHASITVDGTNFVLNHNPSASNPTYVNGRPVGGSHYMQNGDEIQLSSNGPKMRFNTSALKTSTIGLTSRIGQAMLQATKPYKNALIVLSLLLLGTMVLAGYSIYQNLQTSEQIAKLVDEKTRVDDEIAKLIVQGNTKTDRYKRLMKEKNNLENKLNDLRGKGRVTPESPNTVNEPQTVHLNPNFSDLPTDDIYYIYATKVEAAMGGELEYVEADQVWPGEKRAGLWGGTGFLTDDNLFITARHVVQPWRYPNSDWMKRLSYLEANGAILSVTFEALSKNGDRFTFSTKNATFDESSDQLVQNRFEYQGEMLSFTSKENTDGSSDWAFIKMNNRKGKCKINRNLSKQLPAGTRLYPMGYSYTLRLQPSGSALKPLLSECITAQDGLTNEVINTTMRGFGPGNSGGPVFIKNEVSLKLSGLLRQA